MPALRPSAAFLAALLSLPAPASAPDLSTPRRALRAFADAAERRDYRAAAQVLDLDRFPEPERAAAGPRVARELAFLVDAELWIDWDQISDDPQGSEGHSAAYLVGTLSANDLRVPFRLVRSASGAWRIGPSVVAGVPRLYQLYLPPWVGDYLPLALVEFRLFGLRTWQWIGLGAALAAGVVLAGSLGFVAQAAARALARRKRFAWDARLADDLRGPARLLVGTGVFALVAEGLRLPEAAGRVLDHGLRISTVASFSWAAFRGLRFIADLVVARAGLHAGDDGAARARVTQVMVLWRIAGLAVVVIGSSLVLMQFDALRALGTSILASAGVAGVVVGLAAQRSLSTVFAGVQISLTRPIRVGDVVAIESDSGTVEEITLTYVVVRTWDLRRLIVPISRFLDSSFQNWSRSGSSILGTASVYADYGAPIAELRRAVAEFVATRPEWDRKVVSLAVSEATEQSIKLAAVVSSADSDRNGALRDAVREHLVGVLQRLEGGRYLPRRRIEQESGEPSARGAAGAPAGPGGSAAADGGG